MGCDIHCYVEKLDADGVWQVVDPVGNDPRWERPGTIQWDFGRNYCSFAVMADVRNDHGMEPISQPRGLPPDVTPLVKAESDGFDVDGHSHSWLMLSELLDFDFDKKSNKVGTVDMNEYREYLKTGRPRSYSGGVYGTKVKIVSMEDMARIEREGAPDDNHYYTNLKWQDTYRYSCHGLVSFIEKLKKVGPPEKVRVVFWFDN